MILRRANPTRATPSRLSPPDFRIDSGFPQWVLAHKHAFQAPLQEALMTTTLGKQLVDLGTPGIGQQYRVGFRHGDRQSKAFRVIRNHQEIQRPTDAGTDTGAACRLIPPEQRP